MRETKDWVPRPGRDAEGFLGAWIAGPPRSRVPAVFHLPGTCAPGDMMRRDDPSTTLEEVSHLTVEVVLMDRFMDPREPIDSRTGSPLDRAKREEWEAMCDAMAGGEMGEDPRTWPIIDMVRASGRHARPEDPVTGARSNRLFLFSVGDVRIQIPYRHWSVDPYAPKEHAERTVVHWYPSYKERLDRVVKNSSMSLDLLASYMLAPPKNDPFHILS